MSKVTTKPARAKRATCGTCEAQRVVDTRPIPHAHDPFLWLSRDPETGEPQPPDEEQIVNLVVSDDVNREGAADLSKLTAAELYAHVASDRVSPSPADEMLAIAYDTLDTMMSVDRTLIDLDTLATRHLYDVRARIAVAREFMRRRERALVRYAIEMERLYQDELAKWEQATDGGAR